MKIAISTLAPNLDADIDPRFGRCGYFIVIDPDTMAFEALENVSASADGGAGIATAQTLSGKGIEAVITGSCGPNACEALAAANIKVVTNVAGKVRDAVQNYKSGKLDASPKPNVAPHSGTGGRDMGVGRGRGTGNIQ